MLQGWRLNAIGLDGDQTADEFNPNKLFGFILEIPTLVKTLSCLSCLQYRAGQTASKPLYLRDVRAWSPDVRVRIETTDANFYPLQEWLISSPSGCSPRDTDERRLHHADFQKRLAVHEAVLAKPPPSRGRTSLSRPANSWGPTSRCCSFPCRSNMKVAGMAPLGSTLFTKPSKSSELRM